MGEQLCRLSQLQIFHAVSGIWTSLLYVYYRHIFAILHTILESKYGLFSFTMKLYKNDLFRLYDAKYNMYR